ncbi:MAG: Gfo/Idh/MocA family oxidoreductase [Spirochaetales bacterium]|nr:Gfo/Idh/MocA family oxidoreductase [Spirochaetales bacterium]
MQKTPVAVAVIGAGGYAATHIGFITELEKQDDAQLSAVVIRDPSKPVYGEITAELKQRNVRIYRTASELFAGEQQRTDLVVIPSPIDSHADLTIKALEAGFHVLCEKPAAGTTQEAMAMKAASDKTGKVCAIGYHYIFSPGVQEMKKAAVSGQFGKLVSARTIGLLPRTRSYYTRNDWAGKINAFGHEIYDSPLQNATGHYLNTMLYIAGKKPDESARITSVYGENYRAKPIESADTQYLRIATSTGAILHQYATHACSERVEPLQEFFFENGKMEWQAGSPVIIRLYGKRGSEYILQKEIKDTFDTTRHLLYLDIFRAMKENKKPLSTIENSWQQTFAVEKCFLSSNGVIQLPSDIMEIVPVSSDENVHDTITVIRDIIPLMQELYATGKSFSEKGLSWAKQGKVISA